jgi:hypothetical protein
MRNNSQENFYKRLKELSGAKSSNNSPSSLSNSTLIESTKADNGVTLGIIKENHNYFIKTSNSKADKLGADDFVYIGGIENKFKYQYSSLSEAIKNKNFYVSTLNESVKIKINPIAINESENIGNAQSNADSLKGDKAQSEANKNMHDNAKLIDSAKEMTKLPKDKVILVSKESGETKVVDATKVSTAKPISVEKQVKPLKENFGKEESEISSDKPTMPAGDESEIDLSLDAPSDAEIGGDESSAEPEIDAAADALNDMGVDAEEGGEEGMGDQEMGEESGGDIKDIQKLTGKVTQKIRNTEITPEMTKGLLKSFISSFKTKLSELDHEDRKEIANNILKDNDEEDDNVDNSIEGGDNESEIEEAINQHLAEMGIGEDENNEVADENAPKEFNEYIEDKGYDPNKIEEISLMEMVGLMNSYTNECGENVDGEGMSNYVNQDIAEKMNESGNSLFEALMKPFGDKIKKNKKAYANESVIPMNKIFGEDEEEEDEIENGSEEGENEIENVENGNDMEFAPAGQAIAIGSPVGSSNKTVTVDLNNATVNMTMNESSVKNLKTIIKKKISDKLSGKKSPINESKKSALSIMIDEEINKSLNT